MYTYIHDPPNIHVEVIFPPCFVWHSPVSGAFQTQLQAIRGDTAELEELRLQVMYRAGLLHLQADLKAATGWGGKGGEYDVVLYVNQCCIYVNYIVGFHRMFKSDLGSFKVV